MRPDEATGVSGFAAAVLLTGLTVLLLVPAAPVEERVAVFEVSTGTASAPIGTREAPDIVFLMDNYTANATVEPGESGMVIFPGILRVNTSGMYRDDEYFQIELKAEIEEGWISMVTPSTAILRVGQNASINLTCRVPPAVSSSVTGVIALGGTCTPFSSSTSHMIPPAFLYIKVDDYFRFSIESGIPYLDYNGDTAEFLVTVNNEGNAGDIYHVDIMNLDYLEDDDLVIELSTASVIVDEKESESFNLWVDISSSTPSKEYPIHLRFTSLGETDPASGQYEYFYVYLKVEAFGPGWFQRMMYPHLTECVVILVLLAVFITALVMTVRKRKQLVREWVMKIGEMDEPAQGRRDGGKLTRRSDVEHRRVQTRKAGMPPRPRH